MENVSFPTPFKISTITATASLGCESVNLENLFKSVNVVAIDGDEVGFCYIEYGEKRGSFYTKGYHKKMSITRRKEKVGKRFDNQATMTIKHCFNEQKFIINIKVFKNGNVQMTGLKTIPQGEYIVGFLIDYINKVNEEYNIVPPDSTLSCSAYKIRLINSDFKVGLEIRTDKLYKLIQSNYGIFCSYEPCIYPGVKIQYSFNDMYTSKSGVCECTIKCNGKGDGCGHGNCKRVTISVFQSGCVIITGAQKIEQITIAYNFICSVLRKHKEFIDKNYLINTFNDGLACTTSC